MTPHLTRSPRLVGSFAAVLASAALGATACSPPVRADATLEHASQTSPLEKAFAPGGRVKMRLSAGEYVIEPRTDGKVHIEWTTRDADDARHARAAIGIEGTEARIETDGPHNGFHVKIGVPARSDLFVRLTAGELTIKAIEGHKDISALAGEIRVSVDDADKYRTVDAAVMAGEIQARAFGGHKGGLFRAFDWKGAGKYDLKARLSAGEIHLR